LNSDSSFSIWKEESLHSLMNPTQDDPCTNLPFKSQMSSLLLLVAIFFTNFLGRIVVAPLLPVIQKDLHIGHRDAGSLFMIISAGVCVALLCSGFVSSRIQHRRTIIASGIILGVAMIVTSFSRTLLDLRLCLFFIGLAAGLYFPSAIASITALVRPVDWGKALSIHELAPNLGFVAAPFLTELMLHVLSWQQIMFCMGLMSFAICFVYIRHGRGGDFPGTAPNMEVLRSTLSQPSFWVMVVLFGLAVGASLGVYTILPLYLVAERDMERTFVNSLMALSRVPGIAMALAAGWLVDRIGVKSAILIFSIATGIATLLLGYAPGNLVMIVVVLQALLSVCFFPAGFAAISRIVPSARRSFALSFSVPLGVLVGAGGIPSALGWLGEVGSFSYGFVLVGVLIILSSGLLTFLKFVEEEPA
jgi:MFS transporter, NNP family, nitrate/nitrite transporter